MMSKTSRRNFNLKLYLNTRRELVYTAIIGAVSLMLVLVVAVPQVKRISAQRRTLASGETKLEQLRRKLAQLDDSKVMIDTQKLEIMDEVLPDKKPLLPLMAQLSNLTKLTGVKIDNLELSPGVISETETTQQKRFKQTQAYGTLQLKMSISGRFDQVRRFMVLVEKVTPFTTLRSFALASDIANLDKTDEVNVQLETSTFFYQPPAVSKNTKLEPVQLDNADLALLDTLRKFKSLTEPIDVDKSIRVDDLFGIESWENLSTLDLSQYLR